MKMFLCLLSAFFLGTSAGFSQQETTKNSALTKAIELLHLPSTLSLKDFERVVEARVYNLPDSATWQEISQAQGISAEQEYYRVTASKLSMPPNSTKLEIARASVQAEQEQHCKYLGLPLNASQDDVNKAAEKEQTQKQALRREYENLYNKSDSNKAFHWLCKKEQELSRPKIARSLGLPVNSSKKQIEAVQHEETRQTLIRLYELKPSATFDDIERAKNSWMDKECSKLARQVLKIEDSTDETQLRTQLRILFEALKPLYDARGQQVHSANHRACEEIDSKMLQHWAETSSQHITNYAPITAPR